MSSTQATEVAQDIFELIGRGEQIEQAARAMKAISHPLRLKILCVLGDQEVNVQEIVEAVAFGKGSPEAAPEDALLHVYSREVAP